MSKPDIIRAWKDEDYRAGLSAAERALLPENPAGLIELYDADLDNAAGGTDAMLDLAAGGSQHYSTYGCCHGFTSDPSFCSVFSVCGPSNATYDFSCK